MTKRADLQNILDKYEVDSKAYNEIMYWVNAVEHEVNVRCSNLAVKSVKDLVNIEVARDVADDLARDLY